MGEVQMHIYKPQIVSTSSQKYLTDYFLKVSER